MPLRTKVGPISNKNKKKEEKDMTLPRTLPPTMLSEMSSIRQDGHRELTSHPNYRSPPPPPFSLERKRAVESPNRFLSPMAAGPSS